MGCHLYGYSPDGEEWDNCPWIRLDGGYDREWLTREQAIAFIYECMDPANIGKTGYPCTMSYLLPFAPASRRPAWCNAAEEEALGVYGGDLNCTPDRQCNYCKDEDLDAARILTLQQQEHDSIRSDYIMNMDIIETWIKSGRFGRMTCG